MGREREGYRDNYAMLNERFPNKDVLDRRDVALLLGVTTRSRLLSRIRFNKLRLITKADLARQLCE